jgi:hypothetical protein
LVTGQWLLAGVALGVAAAAWAKMRRVARRVERLTEAYWELRYDHSQLRARVNRLDPDAAPGTPAPEPPARTGTAFVPLSSLRGRESVHK